MWVIGYLLMCYQVTPVWDDFMFSVRFRRVHHRIRRCNDFIPSRHNRFR